MATEPTSGHPRRILLIADSQAAPLWLPALQDRGAVHVAATVAEALAALHDTQFDIVICPGSELLPLSTAAARDQARTILDGIALGVCTVSRDGALLWANAALHQYAPEAVEAVRATCAALLPDLVADTAPRTIQRTLSVGQKQFLDLTVSALRDAAGVVDRVVGLVNDTTTLVRMRDKLDAIDAAGRELVALGADDATRMEVPERLQLLEDRLIRYCHDLLDFTHFAVRVLDPQTGRLDTVLSGGFSEAARATSVYARKEGNGITGYVAATGTPYICPDITHDPLYLPGLECARSSLTVPLRLNERIVGVLNIESDQPAAFTDEDRQVAEIFGRYIATALQMLKLLVVERSETTGQLAADVRSELAQPLDDIVAEATHLLAQRPDADETQRRLRAILGHVDRVKETLQGIATPPAIRGLTPESGERRPLLSGKRVLVADDEDIIRETIADVLSKAGALPVTARDGEEAVGMLHTQHLDLVLSDIKMPYKNGYEVFAAAKAVNARCPVILITGFGYDPEHSIVRASREGLAGVLFKPFKVEQLLELIEKAVATDAG
ncbi:MAG: response regulator [Phycisphaerae bacterium]|nr:response regulator [Phycisphaerae bacterium]